MRKKTTTLTFRPNEKVRHYLGRLGFIDGRDCRKRRGDNKSIGKFVNNCITSICESGMNPLHDVCNADELTKSWIKFQIAELNKEMEELGKEQQKLAGHLPTMENMHLIEVV